MHRNKQNPKSNPAPPKHLVIDESVSSRQVGAFIRFCAKRRIACESQLRLAESHPGISDDLVIHHLLGPQTLLLTTDRPFHNKALAAGFQSFHVDEQTRFTGTRLKGIRDSAVTPLIQALRLMLQPLRTTLYFDTDRIPNPDQCGDDLWNRLRQELPRLTLVECRKGPLLERLRAKLATMPRASNEPVDGDLDAIRCRLS